jgi:hypothetical protein
VRKGTHIDHEGYRDHLFPLFGRGGPFVPAWGFLPSFFCLQILGKKLSFSGKK